MAVTVEVLCSEDDEAYELFVRHHPAGMIYYSLRFRDMLVALLGCTPIYGVARRGRDVVGVFPLMMGAGVHGDVLNSLPYFGSNGGQLCGDDDEEAKAALLSWYLAQAERAAAATVIENPLISQSEIPGSVRTERVSVFTSLPSPGEGRPALFQVIDSSARRNVLKAERSGVTVSVAGDDPESLAVLAELHRLSMQLNGGPVKKDQFFELLPSVFRAGSDYQLFLAALEGETVGALLVMFHGSVAEYYVPATLPEARAVQPMAALLCSAMLEAAERGCKLWNWGGSGLGNETLVRFKMKWGGRRSTYRYLTLLNNESLVRTDPDELLRSYPDFYVRPFAPIPAGVEDASG